MAHSNALYAHRVSKFARYHFPPGDAPASPLAIPIRGIARGSGALNRRFSGFFYRKNWLCWGIGPAVFSKVTLFSLPEAFCMLPRASFEGDD